MPHGACYRLTVSSLCFARNWCLLSSNLVCLVESGQTDVAGSFSFVNHDWVLRPKNWNLRPQGFEPPIFRFGSRHPFRWALRTFPILFRYSQWLNWTVKWPSMCSVVSLLLPSFVIWVMMVSWLHFFRLGARLGSSTSFRQWIEKLRPQRYSDPQSSGSKSDALSVRQCGLLRSFPFLFFLQWVTQVRSKTAHSACYRLSVSIFSLLEIDIFWAPV